MYTAKVDHEKTDIVSFVHLYIQYFSDSQPDFILQGNLSMSGDILSCHT